jgi:hypothetical protein
MKKHNMFCTLEENTYFKREDLKLSAFFHTVLRAIKKPGQNKNQCSGSGSASTGSTCFWASPDPSIIKQK